MTEDYKKMYEETKEELESLKSKTFTNKENITIDIAKLFGEDAKEKKEWEDGEKYETFKDFYSSLLLLRKDILFQLLEKVRNIGGRSNG